MGPEGEQIPAANRRRPRRHDGGLLGLGRDTQECRQFVVGPEAFDRDPLLEELPEHVVVPVQIQLGDAIVRQGQLPRARVGVEIQIDPLDDDQPLPFGLHGLDRQVQRPGLRQRLVPGQNAPGAVHDNRPSGPILAQGIAQQLAPPRRPAIGVPGVRRQVFSPANPLHPSLSVSSSSHRILLVLCSPD